jgi:hypothetical protein
MIADASIIVAVVAALVAALSAVYARWQAVAAGRANEIALHESRLTVYKGLGRFRAHISARGVTIKEEEVWRFSEVVELSEFYFPSTIHPRVNKVFEDALKLLSLNDEWEDARRNNAEQANALLKQRHELMRATRDECYKVTDELKKHLRAGAA